MALILSVNGTQPQIADDVFLAANATVIGDVVLEAGTNVWYGAVLRGDAGRIVVGAQTSVQDNVVIHCNDRRDTVVGSGVTIGHGVVLEGCTIGDRALIGMNATVLSGATVGAGALIAAGAVVRENFEVPPRKLAAGVPAKIIGDVGDSLRTRLEEAAQHYANYSQMHRTARVIDSEEL